MVIGIVMSAGILALTGYYTGTEHRPVKDVGKTSLTGAATVILSGLSVGFESAVYTTLVIGAAVFGAYLLGGAALTVSLFAVALAGCGLLTTVGVIVAMDTFGPVSDNAQGIAEMSGDVSPEGAQILTELDAVGNTTKAITKGIAIATAVLAATALFGSYATSVFESLADANPTADEANLLDFAVFNPAVLVGVLVGAAVVFLFSGLAINAVARAAGAVVYEVRRQFREIPGIMEGTGRPEYGKVVDIVTKDSLRELVTPGILAVLAPIAVGFGLGATALAGFLAGAIGTGTLMAVFLANSGGAWDNAKKLVEDGNHGGKGSDAHAATVIGDTVGDPFKDTAGPAINPLIKVMNLVSLLIASAVVSMSVGDDQNDALRITIALVAVAIIAVAVIISKRREVSIGDDQPVENHTTPDLTPASGRGGIPAAPKRRPWDDHGRRFVVCSQPATVTVIETGSPGPSGSRCEPARAEHPVHAAGAALQSPRRKSRSSRAPGHRSGATSTRTSFRRGHAHGPDGPWAVTGRSAPPALMRGSPHDPPSRPHRADLRRPRQPDRPGGGARGHRRPRDRPDLQPRRLRRQGPARPRGRRPVPGAVRGQPPRQLGRLPARPGPRATTARRCSGGSAQLGPGQGEWLRSLPFSHDFVISGRRVRLFHASEETVHRRVRFDHDEAEFRALFTNTPATGDGPTPDVVGYADTHDPYYETDHDRRTVFNTGSVGNCMHDPTPVYVILEGVLDSPDDAPFSIQFVRVPYDVDAEMAAATAMGLPELAGYELEIRHGIYRRNLTEPEADRRTYHRRPVGVGV